MGEVQDGGEPPWNSTRNSLCINAQMLFRWCLLSSVECLAPADVPVLSKGPGLADSLCSAHCM